jgi:hypothetical protein
MQAILIRRILEENPRRCEVADSDASQKYRVEL